MRTAVLVLATTLSAALAVVAYANAPTPVANPSGRTYCEGYRDGYRLAYCGNRESCRSRQHCRGESYSPATYEAGFKRGSEDGAAKAEENSTPQHRTEDRYDREQVDRVTRDAQSQGAPSWRDESGNPPANPQ